MPKYSAVGRCIYCGENELPPDESKFSDEHIIPFSLGGNLILPEASCKKCASIINRQIETPINSHEWGNLRASRNFPSRKKHRRRTHVKLRRRDGKPFKVPIKDYPSPTPVYRFHEARILSGKPPEPNEQSWQMSLLTDSDAEMAMQEKYPDWNGRHRIKPRPFPFARLVAKIGFGYAIAELGCDMFEPIITDVILGKDADYFNLVGGKWKIEEPISGGDHITKIEFLVRDGEILVIAEIRLFSQITTPIHHAVVGRIDLKNPKHVATFEQYRLDGKIEVVPLHSG